MASSSSRLLFSGGTVSHSAILKRDARGRIMAEPKDITETHRRCNQCRQWVILSEYGDKRHRRGTCRLCRNEVDRQEYNKKTSQEIDALQCGARRRAMMRSKELQRNRRRDVDFVLSTFFKRGWSNRRVHLASGVHQDTIKRLKEGGGRFVTQRTVDKLYDAFGRSI